MEVSHTDIWIKTRPPCGMNIKQSFPVVLCTVSGIFASNWIHRKCSDRLQFPQQAYRGHWIGEVKVVERHFLVNVEHVPFLLVDMAWMFFLKSTSLSLFWHTGRVKSSGFSQHLWNIWGMLSAVSVDIVIKSLRQQSACHQQCCCGFSCFQYIPTVLLRNRRKHQSVFRQRRTTNRNQ